jgi:transketolase
MNTTQNSTTNTIAPKKRLTSDAMSASLAREGQRVTAAPLGHALVELAQRDERVVGLSADLAKYTDLHILRDAMPDRFYQVGMAEQALLGMAAGLAMEGFVPFASTYSVFATRRAYDFLCLDIAEANLNVNMVCALPGLTTGYGPSHQATEDVAILRGMPNLTIVDPCDAVDIEQAVPQLAAHDGPTYTRILRGKVPRVLDEYDYTFELGKAKMLRDGAEVLLVSTGLMTERALEAAKALAADKVDVAVLHVPTLKPLDEHTILRELAKDRLVLTCENHTIIGGLFDAVAHAAVRDGIFRQITPIGLPDEFLDAGALPTLNDRYGVSTAKIVEKIKTLLHPRHTDRVD